MTNKVFNVLVLCTGNSARSIMAEALINIMGQGRFKAFSAGSRPTGVVNPFAIELTQAIGYSSEKLRSKNWSEFEKTTAPKMDFVITVCDNAAGESCPFWPGSPVTTHWGFNDPAAALGTNDQKRQAFKKIFDQIQSRVAAFVELSEESLEAKDVQQTLDKIGQL